MNKKIDRFLWIVMILTAALVMFAAALDSGNRTGQVRDPEIPRTDPRPRLEEILDAQPLDRTDRAECIREPKLNEQADTVGLGTNAAGYAFAELCGDREMNPIAAFWLLESEEIYESGELTRDKWSAAPLSMQAAGKRTYEYSDAGAAELLTELLELAGSAEDDLDLEEALLGWNGKVERKQIHQAEDCLYSYFVCYGKRSAHLLCFYLRPDGTGGQIGDAELQLLNLRYAQGGAEALALLDQRGERQAQALMAAAERLLTGESRADQGDLPGTYALAGWQGSLERCQITGSGEEGRLFNYRLHIAQ